MPQPPSAQTGVGQGEGSHRMDVLLAIVKFLVDEIFSKPFYLVGLMTAVGLIALRRPWGQVIGGTAQAAVGVFILAGAAVNVINALGPLGKLLLRATEAPGVGRPHEALVGLGQAR